MMRIFIAILFVSAVFSCTPNEEIRIKISAGNDSFLDSPISFDLSSVYSTIPQNLELFELTEEEIVKVPYQLEFNSSASLLWFNISGKMGAGESREFLLRTKKRNKKDLKSEKGITQSEDALLISDNGRSIVNYRKSEMLPPEGIDELYKRSAYIHPLWSPSGEILTRIQPPDHYHHYGIWNPWTKTHIKGREIDYWNLAKGEGTVRSKAVLNTEEGSLFSMFTALHEHVDFGNPGGERVTMEEFWDVRYWKSKDGSDRYILDLFTTLRSLIQDTILLDAYRYGGGIGYRATEKWNADNCTILTSEGMQRSAADGSRARWCIVEGESDAPEGRSGILFLSHPENREHPEPMRVWPLDVNNGEMFFEFCPIRNVEWIISPGIDYTLKYRMIVFDGSMTPEEAEMYWNGFVGNPVISIDKQFKSIE